MLVGADQGACAFVHGILHCIDLKSRLNNKGMIIYEGETVR